MNLRPTLLSAVVSLRALTFLALLTLPSNAAPQTDGDQLYATHCASCHGLKLEGQPNWMERKPDGKLPAPPHDATGHTWHHSDQQLHNIVRDGLASIAPGYETDMPAFGAALTDAQIMSVMDYIKSKWPPRQQEIQALRTKAEAAAPFTGD